VPVFPILYIGPDLQQSRYLYLAAIGWAALIVVAGSEQSDRRYWAPLSVLAVLGLIVIASYATRLHIQPWNEAARLRERVEASALDLRTDTCQMINIVKLPDSVRGAYVF